MIRHQAAFALLVQAVTTTPSSVAGQPQPYPGEVGAAHARALNHAAALINDRRFAEALQFVAGSSARQIPPAAAAYLRAICHSGTGDLDRALTQCAIACRADPAFAKARILRGRILVGLFRTEDAIAEFRGVLAGDPANAVAYRELVALLLQDGRTADARHALDLAHELGTDIPELEPLRRMLKMARDGPQWSRTHRHESRHYSVFSDIDRDTCVEACRLLELSLATFRDELGLSPSRNRRFRVFIFSDEAEYNAYCTAILGDAPRHTQGLYSPTLKQMVMWNPADPRGLPDTLRHEGMHQFLDHVIHTPPAWLNEGLALDYERSALRSGRPQRGLLRAQLLAAVTRSRMVPLARFLFQPPREFYANAALHYPQSWALVRFLRSTTEPRRQILRRLLEGLGNSARRRRALRDALRDVSIPKLDREFRDFVLELAAETRAAKPR